MKFQSQLGSVEFENRKDVDMGGYMSIGRITKVHHKRNTVDVKLIRTNDVFMGLESNEGKHACKVLVSNAGYNEEIQKPFGVVEPLQEGDLVVVAFLEGLKSQPVILGSIHRTTDESQNILTKEYPLIGYDTEAERYKYLRVFPSQDYFKIDGKGEIEFSTHGKSFLMFKEDIDDLTTDFEDLTEKDKETGETLTVDDYFYQYPKDFLMVFRDNWDDDLSTRTKIFVSQNGKFRVTRDPNDKKLSYIEISESGTIKLCKQNDSNIHGEGNVNSQITINDDGEIIIDHKNEDSTARIHIKDGEIKLKSDTSITLESNTINLNCKTLNTSGKE